MIETDPYIQNEKPTLVDKEDLRGDCSIKFEQSRRALSAVSGAIIEGTTVQCFRLSCLRKYIWMKGEMQGGHCQEGDAEATSRQPASREELQGT